MKKHGEGKNRRTFLKEMAVIGGAAVAATGLRGLTASNCVCAIRAGPAAPVVSTSPWAKQIGLELFTVRDAMTDPRAM